jgi:biopolymer transport protein ExbD
VGTSVKNSAKTSVKAEPNVIPMIDIMLVLLIIFMIVTPLIASGFKAVMPQGVHLDESPEDEERDVVLGIDQNGDFYLNGQMIPQQALEDQLTAIYAARPDDKILHFRADINLKYGRIQDAIEIARRSGVRVMAAVTELKQEGGMFGSSKEP